MEKNALVRGASQYLATLKEAQEQLKNNQILLVAGYEIPNPADQGINKQIVLLEYEYETEILRDEGLQGTDTYEVYLNDAILYIPNQFCYTTPLQKIKLPAKLIEIGVGAFADCNQLEEIQIPETVETIGAGAFAGCITIKDIVIPETVTTIGEEAFLNVPHITYHGSAEGAPWGADSMN